VRRPSLVVAGVCTGWGTIPLLVRKLDMSSTAIVAARLWLAAAGLGVGMIATRRHQLPARPRLLAVEPLRCVGAALALAGHWMALFAAYKRMPAGTVILIVYLAPIGIAGLAPLVLGEPIRRATLTALGLAAVGFGFVAWPAAGGASGTGLSLAVAAAALFVVLVLLSKPLAETYGGLRLAFMEMAGAGMVLIPAALHARWGPPDHSWLWLLVLGLVHTAIGTSLYLAALGRMPATNAAILGYIEPVSVVACGWLFLSQRPSLAMVAGGALIVVAGALVVRSAAVAEEVSFAVAG
jgi:drug/metabolite transporter (DMT)-like permease